MSKRPIPKSSGLYRMRYDPETKSEVRQKITPQETIWLETLSRSKQYSELPDDKVREQLTKIGLQEHIIDAFLACRNTNIAM